MRFSVPSFVLNSHLLLLWRREYKTSLNSLLWLHYNHVWISLFLPSFAKRQVTAPSKDISPCKQLHLQSSRISCCFSISEELRLQPTHTGASVHSRSHSVGTMTSESSCSICEWMSFLGTDWSISQSDLIHQWQFQQWWWTPLADFGLGLTRKWILFLCLDGLFFCRSSPRSC